MRSASRRHDLKASATGTFVSAAIDADELGSAGSAQRRELISKLHSWEPISGFDRIVLKGGAISGTILKLIQNRGRRNSPETPVQLTLDSVTVLRTFVSSDMAMYGCFVVDCKISDEKPFESHKLARNFFIGCDFSGVLFEDEASLNVLLRRPRDHKRNYMCDNYFFVENPPKLVRKLYSLDEDRFEIENIDVEWDLYLRPIAADLEI
jgi:hypothetical protein